jgi:hypothetical protein
LSFLTNHAEGPVSPTWPPAAVASRRPGIGVSEPDARSDVLAALFVTHPFPSLSRRRGTIEGVRIHGDATG